jgi:hypothetical protein
MRSAGYFLAVALAFAPWANAGGVNITTVNGYPTCEVTALGDEQNDVPNIIEAFTECGTSGVVVFPEDQNYWIAEKLNPVVKDVLIDWRGQWTVSRNVHRLFSRELTLFLVLRQPYILAQQLLPHRFSEPCRRFCTHWGQHNDPRI